MAASGIKAPQPSIFQSDPIEQVFARGMLDRDMSGLSGMLMNAERMRRDSSADTYMAGLDRANQQAGALEKLEQAFKFRQAMAEQARHLVEAGLDPTTLSGGPDLFAGNAAAGSPFAALKQDLIRSQIAKNMRVDGGGGGGAGAIETRIQDTSFPGLDNMPGVRTIVTKGKAGPDAVKSSHEKAVAQKAAEIAGNPNATPQQRKIATDYLKSRGYTSGVDE